MNLNYYCENCHTLNVQDCCLLCGKINLRNPDKNDYCFLIEADSMFGEMFIGILEDENIPYSAMPSGNGIRSIFALKLENYKIYVTYEFIYRAKELLNEILINSEEEEIKDLKKNLDRLFASQNSEKKIKKNLKMSENDSLTAYCADKIINADRIINQGKISSCIKGGYYLYVYKGKEVIIINSATYEIISAK